MKSKTKILIGAFAILFSLSASFLPTHLVAATGDLDPGDPGAGVYYYTVKGYLRDLIGNPISGVTLQFYRGGDYLGSATTGSNGFYYKRLEYSFVPSLPVSIFLPSSYSPNQKFVSLYAGKTIQKDISVTLIKAGPDLSPLIEKIYNFPYIYNLNLDGFYVSGSEKNRIAVIAKGITASGFESWIEDRKFRVTEDGNYQGFLADPHDHTCDDNEFDEYSNAYIDYLLVYDTNGNYNPQTAYHNGYKLITYNSGIEECFYILRFWEIIDISGEHWVVGTIHWDEIQDGNHKDNYFENAEDQLISYFAPWKGFQFDSKILSKVLYNRPSTHPFWSDQWIGMSNDWGPIEGDLARWTWPDAFKPNNIYTQYSSLSLLSPGFQDGDSNSFPYPWIGFGNEDSDGNAIYLEFTDPVYSPPPIGFK